MNASFFDRNAVRTLLGRASRSTLLALCAMGTCGVSLLGVGLSAALPAHALAAPEPDPVPRRWQLTLESGPLRVMNVPTADGSPRLYYYMTYTVTNTSGQDLLFTPAFEMASDQGEVVRAGRGVPSDVTRSIVGALENPLIQDQIEIVGMLLQGNENARQGVAVWPVVNNHVSSLEVYAHGFSGETRVIDAFDPETKGTKRMTLRKTLMMRFQPTGEVQVSAEPLSTIESRWIMR